MKLTIDMSPTLVNRTAIYNICNDIVAIFSDVSPSLYYFGKTMERFPRTDEVNNLLMVLHYALSIADQQDFCEYKLGSCGFFLQHRESGERRIFADPLYVLFSELLPTDIVMILDVSTVTCPKWHSSNVSALYTQAFMKISRICPNVVSISENTSYTFYANYGFPLDRIKTVHLYPPIHIRNGSESVTPLHSVKPYFLFVGSLEARKNIVGAIRAFMYSRAHELGYQLLIVGGHGHGADDIIQLAKRTPGVVLYGYATNDDMRSIYAGATGFLYPSYLEGFGVPLLEAMMYGVPSIASTTGACPEVGGSYVTYCDPDDHEGMAREIVRIIEMRQEVRGDLAKNMRDWVNTQFSFDTFKTNIRDIALR